MFGLDDLRLCNAYVPYSNTAIPESVEFRKRWDETLHDVATRVSQNAKMIILGDMNIVHTEKDNDVHAPLQQNKGCFFDWERKNFNRLLANARLVDSFREKHPDEKKCSYYFYNLREALQSGWRIDYALVSESLLPNVINSDILTDFGSGKSVPIILELDMASGQSDKYIGKVEFSKEERKIAKDILTKGILSYHRNWQNGIAALIQKPYAENENAFDRSIEITRMARDFYKEAMKLENLYDRMFLASGIAMFLNEGNLTAEDLKGLPGETQKHLLYKARRMRE